MNWLGEKFDGAPPERSIELFNEHRQRVHRQTDRLFAALMAVQWVFGVCIALWISPRTWIGELGSTHVHVYAAIFMGAALSGLPIALALLRPGRPLTRHVMAASQMLWSALLIHLTGGRIETHFHVFGSLAFLAFYRDWKVLMTAVAVVGADHFLRGVYWPRSVFGVGVISEWRWLEHVGWVLFQCSILVWACKRGVWEMWALATRQASLEESKRSVEEEVRQRTAELSRARIDAESANRAKSEFLANMSHEIRTPMTAIIGYADLLLEPQQSERNRAETIHTIRTNSEHLLAIVNDILDISRIEAGKLEIERIEASPSQIVLEAESLMRGRAGEKGLAFGVEFRTDVPRIARFDPTRLRQILVNLLSNAIKFTEEGGVRLFVSASGSRMRFEVADTGVGMTAEQIDRLFQPFSQADSSTVRRFGGTGLGLSISMRLAQMLGGDITVRSEPGVGSSFVVEIEAPPVNGCELHRPGAGEAHRESESNADSDDTTPPSLSGVRVLVAEDGPDNQRLITHHLERAGATVTLAGNGERACELAMEALSEGRPYDVVVMDMQMPVLDGYQAAGRLRAERCPTPIIALTAHAMSGDRERCLASGCDDYLTKPIQKLALLQACARWAADGRAAPDDASTDAPASTAN
ncbi:MAG: response regulator [Phycisphaeraceae bacterium]|nr:MAG: response regulator [Phycisphaeraceae bacterium]